MTRQLYLRMDRPDLALKQVKTMRAADEDHTLTMLATAWTNLSSGGAKGAQVRAKEREESVGCSHATCGGWSMGWWRSEPELSSAH